METEPFNGDDRPYEPVDNAGLARDVQYLKEAVASLAERVSRQESIPRTAPVEVDDATGDDEDRAILAYLKGPISSARREETRRALDELAALVHQVAEENGMTEDELAAHFAVPQHSTTMSK